MRVTCPYGKPGKWAAGWHIGADMVGDDDKTIYPIAEGTVESINNHGSAYGNHVCIKHPDGNVSLYAHMSKVSVKVGQDVKLGTPLGIMGATGNANGAHLHLELHRGAYKYPRGYRPKTAPWLLDPVAWIEDHIEEGYQVDKLTIIKDGPASRGQCSQYRWQQLHQITRPAQAGRCYHWVQWAADSDNRTRKVCSL